MDKILKSSAVAWLAVLVVMILLVSTFSLRGEWWQFFDIFFLFMMAFSHAIATFIARFSKYAAKRLNTIAVIMAVLALIAIVLQWIVF